MPSRTTIYSLVTGSRIMPDELAADFPNHKYIQREVIPGERIDIDAVRVVFIYLLSDGSKCDERHVCRHCVEEHLRTNTPFEFADTRHSFGIYAGKYCDKCWKESGYRDATDQTARFDPMDAGEALEPEDS